MKLIARAEQIGMTWQGTTRRARSILQQPKTQQNHNYGASIENQLQTVIVPYFNIRGIVKVVLWEKLWNLWFDLEKNQKRRSAVQLGRLISSFVFLYMHRIIS